MTRDQLVAKMIAVPQHADISVTVGIMLDVVLAEALQFVTREECREESVMMMQQALINHVFERRLAQYAPREKTLQTKVEDVLRSWELVFPRVPELAAELVALLEEGGRK